MELALLLDKPRPVLLLQLLLPDHAFGSTGSVMSFGVLDIDLGEQINVQLVDNALLVGSFVGKGGRGELALKIFLLNVGDDDR